MIRRSDIKTRFAYFILYTKLENMKALIYSKEESTEKKEDVVDKVIKDFADNLKLLDHPFLGALAAMRSDKNKTIIHEKSKRRNKFFTQELKENLHQLSFFRKMKLDD